MQAVVVECGLAIEIQRKERTLQLSVTEGRVKSQLYIQCKVPILKVVGNADRYAG